MRGKTTIPKERRKNPRIDFRLSVAVGGQKGLKEIQNFGVYGVFVKTDTPSQFKPRQQIFLVMRLPHERRAVTIKSKVVHVSKKGIGVEFAGVSPQNVMSLEQCFHIFKSTMPMPGI